MKNALYGFKRAGKDFGEKVIKIMRRLGSTQVRDVEESMWIRGNVLVIIYVDDCLTAGPKEEALIAHYEVHLSRPWDLVARE